MPTLKSSLSLEQVAEKFDWGVLRKWQKCLTWEYGASGCAVKFVWMEQAAICINQI